jgi:hypothetical protein
MANPQAPKEQVDLSSKRAYNEGHQGSLARTHFMDAPDPFGCDTDELDDEMIKAPAHPVI